MSGVLPHQSGDHEFQSSRIHKLDPRLRIVVSLLFAATVVFCSQLLALGLALLMALSATVAAELSIRHTLRRLLTMDLLLLFMLIWLPFTLPGTPLFWIGDNAASLEGALKACEIALKANAVVLALLALVGSMATTTFGHALARLKMPKKLVQLLLFTMRYLDVVDREYQRMRNAMKARAFVLRGNLHSWRSIGYLLGMLLVRSLERSERVVNAMKCRGYTGQLYLFDDMKLKRTDQLFFTFSIVLLVTILSIDQL